MKTYSVYGIHHSDYDATRVPVIENVDKRTAWNEYQASAEGFAGTYAHFIVVDDQRQEIVYQ